MIAEGLSIVKGVSGRYDGVRRNPWDQIEWGHHYARAMASYSVLLALSGFRYSAVDRMLAFAPAMNRQDFRCFFAAGTAWGLYSQLKQGDTLTARLECRYGALMLRRLYLGNGGNKMAFAKATLIGPDGKHIQCSLKSSDDRHEIEIAGGLTLQESETVKVVLQS